MKLDAIFRPRSVAVVGASRTPGKVGYILTKNMIESGYGGEIYPINPNAEEILGYKCYPSVQVLSTAEQKGIPILLVPFDTYTTVTKLEHLDGRIVPAPTSSKKIQLIRQIIGEFVDWRQILDEYVDCKHRNA